MRIRSRLVVAAALVAWVALGFVSFGAGLAGLVGGKAAPALDEYGGDNALPIANASGYFQTRQVNGAWWMVTPAGHAFYSLGVDAISTTQGISITNGYANAVRQQYASTDAWAATAAGRLQQWGFNTIGAWSNAELEHRGVAHTRILHLVAGMPTRVNWVFPDVFDPAWPGHLQARVNALISDADVNDPWLLGWYLDNELWWYQDGAFVDQPNNTVVENYIAQPITSTAKLAWVSYLESRYPSIAALNAAWGTQYRAFRGDTPDTLQVTSQITTAAADADKMGFLKLVADKFFSASAAAVRARDAHHLILGVRFLPQPALKPVVEAAAPYVDVLTANLYNKDFANPDLSAIDDMATWSGKPILITEFTARAVDSGMPNGFTAPGKVVPSQEARADAYRIFLDQLLNRPYIVGAHWYSYADDPPLGARLEQSNNWGLVNNLDQPYTALLDRVALYNRNVYATRQGQPDPRLSVPSPIAPTFGAPIFGGPVQLTWSAVAGAGGYTVQLARNPGFFAVQSYITAAPVYTVAAPAAGRWYWRVRVNSSQSDALAYTSPWPFYVYQVAESRPLTAADWPWQPTAAVAITASGGSLSFSGKRDPNSNFASISGTLSSAANDWRNYDYLALDVTSNAPAQLVINLSQRDSDNSFAWFATLQRGDNPLVERIAAATERDVANRKLELDKLGALSIGTRLPAAGQQSSISNVRLLRVQRDSLYQTPVVIPQSITADASGTVSLDWRDYLPVTTTVAYNIYASDGQSRPGNTNTPPLPTLTIDAAAQQSRVRVYRDAGGTLKPMQPNQRYVLHIAPVDVWGQQQP